MKTIDDVLLAHGGGRVFHQDRNFDDEVIARGQLVRPETVTLKRGRPHNCHRNTSGLYLANHPDYRICTGYVLAGDLWLRHSWLVDQRDGLIETTERSKVYFGVRLDDFEAARFVFNDVSDITPNLLARCREQNAPAGT